MSLDNDPYLLMNYLLVLDAILDPGFFADYYRALAGKRPVITAQEVLAFVPALKSGGSLQNSKVERVPMKEHLLFLAQLFHGRAKRV